VPVCGSLISLASPAIRYSIQNRIDTLRERQALSLFGLADSGKGVELIKGDACMRLAVFYLVRLNMRLLVVMLGR